MKHCLRVGVGGPVGSGKTALLRQLCKALKDHYDIAVVTNDIYTREDADFLLKHDALPADRILGVETGGCPHTAIREDASMNLAAVAELQERFPEMELVLVESGGYNLAAYNASKAALNMYTVHLAHELADTAIKVNAAHPGWVKTDMGGEQAPMDIVQGAKTSVALATLGEDGPSGAYIHLGDTLPW